MCIKMDLTLITYNGWCAIKPNQTKPCRRTAVSPGWVTVSSGKNTDLTCKTHLGYLAAQLPSLVDLASLVCDMNWWLSCSFGTAICGRWFSLQWWRLLYSLLMRPNKVETFVQCSRMSCIGVRRIFRSW